MNGRRGRRWSAATLVTMICASACASRDANTSTLLVLDQTVPGQTVGLIATETDDGRYVEWVDRLNGTFHRLDIDDDDAAVETLATIDVGTDGEQRGLLGQLVIGGRRFASWTVADSFDLVVGELLDDGSTHIVWNAGPSSDGAIGGVLAQRDDQILIGVGRNTGWDTTTKVGGAILTIDPDGPPTQAGTALSVGYTNPWAFVVTLAGDVWVADNASGPDPDDESRDDVERIGRADLVDDRNDMAEVVGAGRAPTAMVELSDGRLGICGFLDNEMHAFEVVDTDAGPRTALERAGTIMPCLTGAAVFADGTIVTATQDGTGNTLQIRRP